MPPPVRRLRREPSERMLHIHQLVAGDKFPNIRTVAAELGTSAKTIKRDIQYMRDHFDLPFAYDRRRHRFYYSRPVDHFPSTPPVALDRITVPVPTSDTFTIPASFDPRKYLGVSFSMMKCDGDYEVVIELPLCAGLISSDL